MSFPNAVAWLVDTVQKENVRDVAGGEGEEEMKEEREDSEGSHALHSL